MLLKSSGTRRAFRRQKARYPKIEEKRLKYVSEKQQFGYAVSTDTSQLKTLALAVEQGIDGFKSSRGWMDYVSQRLPNVYEEKISCFQKYFINLRR
jgi:hypothetical protein